MKRWELSESDLMVQDLQEKLPLSEGSIFVIGCSTSEIQGKFIGKFGSLEIAQQLWESFSKMATQRKIHLAFQCCEHLNRSLVVEKELAQKMNWQIVTAKPVINAGGSMATIAWERMQDPVLVEKIKADGGIDIGQTLIGMHLKKVAVPVRLERKLYGEAILSVARTRPPLIGGERAQYPEKC